ncbi:sigma 54-interacting transcriptional regulator [Dehalobacter sp. DCM]|uniref:sigma-54 interaction domain-containing protein n=1 Tax=Dehalobacter sp. DCM TaxID=2907827 RepID=UPI00308134D9|nr:sigma 54-interacting transcriptional regulator [Dehalobacter sp. DCM]
MPSNNRTVNMGISCVTESDHYRVFESLPHSLFILDPKGNVLLSNSTPPVTLGMTLDQFLKSNVKQLVQEGFYDHSFSAEAAQDKCEKGGLIKTKLNISIISLSTPVLDENGKVKLVVTTSLPKLAMEKLNIREVQEYNALRNREIEYLRTRVLESDKVIAESPLMRKVFLSAHAVAQTDSTVMLYGESGTGKEVLAQYIHRHSKREQGPFVTVNCAALPEQLVESELFGYEKAAFTGASAHGKAGLFEAANHGTLFLDEIGELPLSFQAKLLRVVESGQLRRIGGLNDRPIDVRLVAATNRNLEKMTEVGSFRSDLFYRLNVFPIHIPPLRERREDIIPLATMFMELFRKKYNPAAELDLDTLLSLQSHDWPGNVRELRNVIERQVINSLMITSSGKDLEQISSLLPREYQDDYLLGHKGTLKEVLRDVEKKYITKVLIESGGKLGLTADKLGIYRTSLYRKLKEFMIENDL